MSNREKLREELLRQDGIVPNHVPDRHLKAVHSLVAKNKRSKQIVIRSIVGCYLASVLMFLIEIFITHFYILSPDSSLSLGYMSRSDQLLYHTCRYTAIGLFGSGMLVSLVYFCKQRARRTTLRRVETNLPDLAAKLGK